MSAYYSSGDLNFLTADASNYLILMQFGNSDEDQRLHVAEGLDGFYTDAGKAVWQNIEDNGADLLPEARPALHDLVTLTKSHDSFNSCFERGLLERDEDGAIVITDAGLQEIEDILARNPDFASDSDADLTDDSAFTM